MVAAKTKEVPLSKQELTKPFAKSKGYIKGYAISIEAVQRYKNSDLRSFAIMCQLKDTTERVVMKDDDGALLGFMKWKDIYDLHEHPDGENDKFVFPEDDQPIITLGYRGAGVTAKAFISDITSPIKPEPTKPTPTIPARTEDDIRQALAKIAVDYSIPETVFLLWIPEVGNIEDAAKDNIGAQLFLDRFQTKCLEHNAKKSGIADMTPEQARESLSGRSDLPTHIETHEDTAMNETTATPDPDLQALKDQTDNLNAWVPRDDDPERPAALTAGEQAVADVQAIKNAKDSDVIEGEIVSEEPAEPEPTIDADFVKNAGEIIAKKLQAAFPDSTAEYRRSFFEIATGRKTAALALESYGAIKLFKMLDDEIAKAKQSAANLPPSEKAPEKPPISNEAPTTPAEPTSSNASQSDATAGQTSTALTVATSEGNALAIPHRSKLIPTTEEWTFFTGYADAVAKSRFYKGVDTKEKALVVMMKGWSLSIDPNDALDGYDVIDDPKRGLSLFPRVKLLRALVNRTGKCQRFDIVSEDNRCTVTCQRKGGSVNVYKFTIEEAKSMNLTSKYNWQTMQKRMLMWRACGIAIAADFPEVLYSFGNSGTNIEEDQESPEVAA